MKDGLNSGVGAGKDRILRQPLQRGVRGEGKMLAQQRLWPSAAIKLAPAPGWVINAWLFSSSVTAM